MLGTIFSVMFSISVIFGMIGGCCYLFDKRKNKIIQRNAEKESRTL